MSVSRPTMERKASKRGREQAKVPHQQAEILDLIVKEIRSHMKISLVLKVGIQRKPLVQPPLIQRLTRS